MSDEQSKSIPRYSYSERVNHWIIALTFILLTVSGLALFHPSLFWMSNLLGGGTWTRILHPFIGIVMFVSFMILAIRLWRYNLISKNDVTWLGKMGDVLNNREEHLPEVDRYNAGQKLLFWTLVKCMIFLLLSGIVIWRVYFGSFFPVDVIRIGAVIHALVAFILICAIITHIYAAIWVKGTMRAMIRGNVAAAWVYKHHRAWYKKMIKK